MMITMIINQGSLPFIEIQELAGIKCLIDSNTCKDIRSKDTTSGELWEWSHRVDADNNRFEAWYNDGKLPVSSWTNVMSMTTNGNVGISTTDPSEKLDVAGNVIAYNYLNHSDARLKKDITTIDNALVKVLALRGVEFKWQKEEYPEKGLDEGQKIGLIAQEVEDVLPEVVTTVMRDIRR